MQIFLSIEILLLGLVLGSFLGLAAVRIPAGESIVHPRSRCPSCRRQLSWYENIPVFSYLFLKGRCRGCGVRVSPHYLILELATAAVTLYAFYRLTPWPRFLLYLLLFLLPILLVIVIDWKEMIIPDAITLPGIAAGFFVHWVDGRYFQFPARPNLHLLTESLLGTVVGGGTLLTIALLYQWLRHREGMGGGDIKLAAMLGAFFGWKAIFIIFFLASFLGVIAALLLMVVRRQSVATPLPFGTCLGLVAIIYVFQGESLIYNYIKIIKNII